MIETEIETVNLVIIAEMECQEIKEAAIIAEMKCQEIEEPITVVPEEANKKG